MRIIKINKENISDYRDHIGVDVAEKAIRSFSHGLVAIDKAVPVASVVWEQKNIMSSEPCESLIFHFSAGDDEANELLLSEYRNHMIDEDIYISKVQIAAKGHVNEKKALQKAGFRVSLGENDVVEVKLSVMLAMPLVAKVKKLAYVHPLNEMSDIMFNENVRKMLFLKKYGLCEDIAFLKRSHFDEEVSCYFEKDRNVRGLMLVHRTDNGSLRPELLTGWGADFNKILPVLLAHSVIYAGEICDPGATVIIDRHNTQLLALVEKILPEKIGVPVYIGERYEKEKEEESESLMDI